MLEAIKYNLAHVADFFGRDSRRTFWWYVLFLALLHVVLGMIASIPVATASIGAAVEGARSGLSGEAIHAAIMREFADRFRTTLFVSLGFSVVIVLLFVASFVRRLHDSGHTGWWSMIPVATQIVSAIVTLEMSDGIVDVMLASRTPGDFTALEGDGEISAWSLVPWLGYLVVVVFGLLKSDPRANRYGEAPVAS